MPIKNSKGSKSKSKEDKVDEKKAELEIDSDVENSDADNEMSEDENSDVEESSNEISDNDEPTDDTKTKDSKTDKQIDTFESVFKEITDLRSDILNSESDKNSLIKEYDLKLKEITDAIKKFKSTEKKLMEKIPKIHKSEILKASKEKRKRNKENKGGFNKEAPVPDSLREFLGLGEDVLLSRPSVMSKVNDKFKQLGLKEGQKTILDKKTAKKFGLKAGHIIPFEGMQTFLKDQYNNSTEV